MTLKHRQISLGDELSDAISGELGRKLLALQRTARQLEDLSAEIRELACELPSSGPPENISGRTELLCAGATRAALLLFEVERICAAVSILTDLHATELDFSKGV